MANIFSSLSGFLLLENDCNWLTFYPTSNFCQLYGNCSNLDSQFCKNCLSAQTDCIPDEPACQVEGNCQGIALHSEQTATDEDCLQLCDLTLGCRWFTFFTSGSECVLLQNCPTIDESCEDCISGERRCIDGLISSSTEDISTTATMTTTTPYSSSTTADTPRGNIQIFILI